MDGKEVRQLTRAGDFNTFASFSPDGKYLAFIRGQPPDARVMIVNIETGQETLICNDAVPSHPVWITIPERKD